jgi:hypothetical protein
LLVGLWGGRWLEPALAGTCGQQDLRWPRRASVHVSLWPVLAAMVAVLEVSGLSLRPLEAASGLHAILKAESRAPKAVQCGRQRWWGRGCPSHLRPCLRGGLATTEEGLRVCASMLLSGEPAPGFGGAPRHGGLARPTRAHRQAAPVWSMQL